MPLPSAAAPSPAAAGEGLLSTAMPLLRPEEEPILGFWIEAGVLAAAALAVDQDPASRAALEVVRTLGQRSLERMTRSNVRLVYFWVSRSWTGRDTGGLDVEDLAAAGIEGLIHAIWMWDYRRGLKFSTYASWWIRQSLDRAAIRARGLRPNAIDTDRLSQLFRTRAELEVRLGRSASTRELADALQITVAGLKDLQLLDRNVRFTVRLDGPVGDDTGTTLGDILTHPGPSPETVVEETELRNELANALQHLTPREQAVLMARVGWGGPVLSEEELANRFGVTVAQVRSTTQGALARLRALLGDALAPEVAA